MKEKIKKLNEMFVESGLKVAQIVEKTGISNSTVSRYVNGKTTRIREVYYSSIFNVINEHLQPESEVEAEITKDDTEKISEEMMKNGVSNKNTDTHVRNKYKKPRRGDIFYIKNNYATGTETWGTRVGVIISNDKLNDFLGTYEVCYLTSKPRSPLPTHVNVKTNRETSIVRCEQIYSVSKERIENYLCTVTLEEMSHIERAVRFSTDIKNQDKSPYDDYDVIKAERDLYKKFYEDIMKINMLKVEHC